MPLAEMTERPSAGRAFTGSVWPGVDGAAPTGRIRLDAIARFLQDLAYRDVVDAGWERPAPWLVRRLRIRVERFPVFPEPLELVTWCSGVGSAVAERRTSLRGERGARVETTALWVAVDAETRRPAPLDRRFLELYAPSAAGRRSRPRLRHPATPPEDAERRAFRFRAADLDPAGHVNNAAYWTVLEEELGALDPGAVVDAEIEHRSWTVAGPVDVCSDGAGGRWVVGPDGEVVATFLLAAGPG